MRRASGSATGAERPDASLDGEGAGRSTTREGCYVEGARKPGPPRDRMGFTSGVALRVGRTGGGHGEIGGVGVGIPESKRSTSASTQGLCGGPGPSLSPSTVPPRVGDEGHGRSHAARVRAGRWGGSGKGATS